MQGQRLLQELCNVGEAITRLQGGTCTIEAVGTEKLWTARVGRPEAAHCVVITAGLHAAELLGVAAALACIRAAKASALANVCVHVLPAADAENVQQNAHEVLRAGHLAALLGLESPRDLEHALWPSAPQTEAIRGWLDTLPSMEAYLSFHAASCLSGGAFFYVQGQGPAASTLIASLRDGARSFGVPLLAHDPTPVPSDLREPGFFRLRDLGRGALAHVHERFAPKVSLVSKIPVGIVRGAPSAAACRALSRRYAEQVSAGQASACAARLLDPEAHVQWLVRATMHLAQALDGARPSPSSFEGS